MEACRYLTLAVLARRGCSTELWPPTFFNVVDWTLHWHENLLDIDVYSNLFAKVRFQSQKELVRKSLQQHWILVVFCKFSASCILLSDRTACRCVTLTIVAVCTKWASASLDVASLQGLNNATGWNQPQWGQFSLSALSLVLPSLWSSFPCLPVPRLRIRFDVSYQPHSLLQRFIGRHRPYPLVWSCVQYNAKPSHIIRPQLCCWVPTLLRKKAQLFLTWSSSKHSALSPSICRH